MSYGASNPKRKKSHPPEDRSAFPFLLKSAALGAGISLLCATALLLVGATVCYFSQDPTKMTLPLGLAILYLSCLIGGFVTLRRTREKAILGGVLCGGILLAVLWLISLFFQGSSPISFGIALLCRLLMIPAAILGAFLGIRRSPTRRRRK